jgi:alpha,alpha-trehalase
MKTIDFILENFPKTIRDPKFNGKELPNSYITPCAEGVFQNFYYWDTYFINVGLIALSDLKMVRNNLNIMKHFVNKCGFIPNADHLLKGSQPPLFTRGVYDLYKASNDINDIISYAYSCLKELEFWENNRQTSIGLNQHKCSWSSEDCLCNYDYFVNRVDGLSESEKEIDKVEIMNDFYAIAES